MCHLSHDIMYSWKSILYSPFNTRDIQCIIERSHVQMCTEYILYTYIHFIKEREIPTYPKKSNDNFSRIKFTRYSSDINLHSFFHIKKTFLQVNTRFLIEQNGTKRINDSTVSSISIYRSYKSNDIVSIYRYLLCHSTYNSDYN